MYNAETLSVSWHKMHIQTRSTLDLLEANRQVSVRHSFRDTNSVCRYIVNNLADPRMSLPSGEGPCVELCQILSDFLFCPLIGWQPEPLWLGRQPANQRAQCCDTALTLWGNWYDLVFQECKNMSLYLRAILWVSFVRNGIHPFQSRPSAIDERNALSEYWF